MASVVTAQDVQLFVVITVNIELKTAVVIVRWREFVTFLNKLFLMTVNTPIPPNISIVIIAITIKRMESAIEKLPPLFKNEIIFPLRFSFFKILLSNPLHAASSPAKNENFCVMTPTITAINPDVNSATAGGVFKKQRTIAITNGSMHKMLILKLAAISPLSASTASRETIPEEVNFIPHTA